LEHAIDNLKISGLSYVEYLKSKSYRHPNIANDFMGSILRSEFYAEPLGINLYNDERLKKTARDMNTAMKSVIIDLTNRDKNRTDSQDFANDFFRSVYVESDDTLQRVQKAVTRNNNIEGNNDIEH